MERGVTAEFQKARRDVVPLNFIFRLTGQPNQWVSNVKLYNGNIDEVYIGVTGNFACKL